MVENDLLRVTKNHKKRDPRPALPGIDLLSALFLIPQPCEEALQVHTGRDGYRFNLSAQLGELGCRYNVRSDEERDYQLVIAYRRLADLLIPQRIDIDGPLNGYLILTKLEDPPRVAN